MIPRLPILFVVLVVGALATLSAAQPPTADPVSDISRRLESLNPADPQAYFDLGEEVADTADDPGKLALARRLFVLAQHLDRARGGQRVAASACLALADLATRERDRRWLQSLAGTMDQRLAGPAWVRRAQQAASGQAGYNAATALGLVRSGDGVRARQAIADPVTHALLRSYERLLNPGGLTGSLRTLEREAERWPCPECHNQRIVKRAGSGREPQYRLCTNCSGHPGPALGIPELIAHLRFESLLLNGIQRSWSAQTAADRGAPLRDPDPDDIAPAFDVDPSQTIYRAGQWAAPAGVSPAAPPTKPIPPAKPAQPRPGPGGGADPTAGG